MWSIPTSDNVWELTLNKFVNSGTAFLQFWSTKLYPLSLCKHECLLVSFREIAKLKSEFKVLIHKFNKNTEKTCYKKCFNLIKNLVLPTYNSKKEALYAKGLIFHQYATKISCRRFNYRTFSSKMSWRKEETSKNRKAKVKKEMN